MSARTGAARIDWVHYAIGICIVLVVMMHSTLGIETAAGELSWLNGFIEWAKPFRMPDFSFISGLFAFAREVGGLNLIGILGGLAIWAVINAILVDNSG